MSFSIKELESLSGIKAHTIRIWEQRYNFLKPSRTSTNIRTYSSDELKTLLTVALLNKYGYKISRIDEMQTHQREHAILTIQQAEAKNEHTVNLLIGCMIELNTHQFEVLLNDCVTQKGLNATIESVIFLFLEKIGILWQTNRIHPAHEHIVTNIIRQKIIAAIDQLPLSQAPPAFLLFLPEDEHHELGLLYVYFMLKAKRAGIIYLGANVPFKDVCYMNEIKAPKYLYIHSTVHPRQQNFQKYIEALSSKATGATILISGAVAQAYKKNPPSNVVLLKYFSEVISYISSL